jgi:hypothetical protein
MVQPPSRDAGSQQPGKGNIVTGVDAVPVTLARRPPEGLDNKLPNPGAILAAGRLTVRRLALRQVAPTRAYCLSATVWLVNSEQHASMHAELG